MAAIDPQLLQMLICPVTRSPLRQKGNELVSEQGGLRYPIHEGIPVLLPDEATLPEGIGDLAEFKRRFSPQNT